MIPKKIGHGGRMKNHLLAVFLITAALSGLFLLQEAPVAVAAPLKDTDVPEQLLQWKSWVLHDMEEKQCPTNCDNDQEYRCAWPSRLNLSVHKAGGSFEQEWTVFSPTWARLPGGADTWPASVKDGDHDTPVINKNDQPFVHLEEGGHIIKGSFSWQEMPEMILVPPETGIVSLTLNEKRVDYPVIDKTGGLWLQKRVTSEDQVNTQSVSIFRLLSDTIPLEITTHLQVNISGQAREIRFEKVLLPDTVPMRMTSPLPVRIGDTGELMIQARPGHWEIEILSRQIGSPAAIGPLDSPYGEEIWSFSPQNHLRMVQIEGVPSVEPGRTHMPPEWQAYSAYRVDPGASIQFKILKRGDPDPAPNRLILKKSVWLDFNGHGFTIQDTFTGTVSRTWRLSMNPPGELGRVLVDGEGQLITADPKTRHAGVELRKGDLKMDADSRYTASTTLLPAVGWDQDVSAMSGVLNLPPGWKIFAAKGVDKMPGTWVLKWTLLDFFLVLIIAAAVFKLKGWKWGLVSFITMTAIYHETGAPRIVWLHILASLSLIAILPDNRFKRLVYLWGGGAVLALLLIVIPFMVTQIRHGIFPQLDLPHPYFQARDEIQMEPQGYVDSPAPAMLAEEPLLQKQAEPAAPPEEEALMDTKQRYRSKSYLSGRESVPKQALFAQDPHALIQTGPGLPSWKWQSIPMTWNGPVNKDQEIRLWLISPAVNLILSCLRVILLGLMMLGVIDIRSLWQKVKKSATTVAAVAASILVLVSGTPDAFADASVFPPQELLDKYQERLLEKADCFPHCADSLKMDVAFEQNQLRILLEIHAAAKTAIPLPGSVVSWTPEQIFLNDTPLKELSRDSEGTLWALVPYGIHRILLTGKTGTGNTLQIPLPLKPHVASYAGNGWELQGIHKEGKVEFGIQLTRLQKETADPSLSATISLPPFLHIERTLHLGLTWEVSTTVTRVTPLGTPIVVSVPLIDGESVTTASVRVENGMALVNMDSGTTQIQWNASLKTAGTLSLKAPESVPWTESWILDASPIWHCEPSGIPIIHHQDEQGQWKPQWRPWPGEAISISVTRPEGIPGKITTIDSAELILTPGLRSNKARLTIHLRASQGGQHKIILPEKAELQVVTINDKSQPIQQENQTILLPLQPGSQSLFLEWIEPSASAILIRGPVVQIGEEAVNAHVRFEMPQNRWILWASGPTLGPAVLFWSHIIIIILIAFCLGRISITPLKTHHWMILSLGLTQIPIYMALFVAGWFFVLGLRKKYPPLENPFYFNLSQFLIGAWTLLAFLALYAAVSNGLLGTPDMQISGNGSTAANLNWTSDRIKALMPQPVVLSLPKIVYNVIMLIWALWLALYLIRWLRWGWGCFAHGEIWKKPVWKLKKSSHAGPDVS